MDLLLGLLFAIIETIIEGVFGMLAWNMAIPVIFEGAPTISLLQSIIITFVAGFMTNRASVDKNEIDTESLDLTEFVAMELAHIFMKFSVNMGMLLILWLTLKAY